MFLFILLSILAGFFVCLCVYFAIMTCCVCKNRQHNDNQAQQQQPAQHTVAPTAEAKMDSEPSRQPAASDR